MKSTKFNKIESTSENNEIVNRVLKRMNPGIQPIEKDTTIK